MAKTQTKQETFDLIAAHLLAQNAKSAPHPESLSCFYRGPEGRKCAAGAAILDEHYDPTFENQTISSKAVREALIKSGVALESMPLVGQLQTMHDAHPVKDWRYLLLRIAKKHNLAWNHG